LPWLDELDVNVSVSERMTLLVDAPLSSQSMLPPSPVAEPDVNVFEMLSKTLPVVLPATETYTAPPAPFVAVQRRKLHSVIN